MIIKPVKSRKGEKPTSENRRKINGLKASKIEIKSNIFHLELQKFPDNYTVLLRIIAFLNKTFNRWVSLYRITEKAERAYECPKQWLST